MCTQDSKVHGVDLIDTEAGEPVVAVAERDSIPIGPMESLKYVNELIPEISGEPGQVFSVGHADKKPVTICSVLIYLLFFKM